MPSFSNVLIIPKKYFFSNIYYLLSINIYGDRMPSKGYRNFTIRSEAAEKLETYASLNGLKVVQFVNKIAEVLQTDIPFMYLLRAIKNARLFMLEDAVEAEYLRDLLVRLLLNLESASMSLQSIISSNDPYLSHIKGSIAPIINAINYQVARLEKILNESYPDGWVMPMPSLPATHGFLLPPPILLPEVREKLINMQLDNLLRSISNQLDDSMQILDKIKQHLPKLCESIHEALTNILSSIAEIRTKEIKLKTEK